MTVHPYSNIGMGTGLLEWVHILLLLHDPIDLKFASLIQRVFLMRLEHSDLINNLHLFSKLILNFGHLDPIQVFPTLSMQNSVCMSHTKDVTILEEVCMYPQYTITQSHTWLLIIFYSVLRITLDLNTEKNVGQLDHRLPQ